jgi:hypothetical protein
MDSRLRGNDTKVGLQSVVIPAQAGIQKEVQKLEQIY